MGCCFRDLFNITRNVLLQLPPSFFSKRLVSVQVVYLYSSMDNDLLRKWSTLMIYTHIVHIIFCQIEQYWLLLFNSFIGQSILDNFVTNENKEIRFYWRLRRIIWRVHVKNDTMTVKVRKSEEGGNENKLIREIRTRKKKRVRKRTSIIVKNRFNFEQQCPESSLLCLRRCST